MNSERETSPLLLESDCAKNLWKQKKKTNLKCVTVIEYKEDSIEIVQLCIFSLKCAKKQFHFAF